MQARHLRFRRHARGHVPAGLCAMMNNVADTYGFRRVEPDEVDSCAAECARTDPASRRAALEGAADRPPHAQAEERREPIGLFDGVDPMLYGLSAGGIMIAMVTSDNESDVHAGSGRELASLVSPIPAAHRCSAKTGQIQSVLAAPATPRPRRPSATSSATSRAAPAPASAVTAPSPGLRPEPRGH